MSFLYRNERTGWIGLRLDGALRHVPSMEVFFRLYQGDPKVLGMIRFESDRDPTGRPLCGRAAVFRSGGRVFLVDEHPDRSGALVRRPLAPGAFAAYGFAESAVRAERTEDPTTEGALVSHVPRTLYVDLAIAGKAAEPGWLDDDLVAELRTSGFTTLCLFGGHVCSSVDPSAQGILSLGNRTLVGDRALNEHAPLATAQELTEWNRRLVALKTAGAVSRILLTLGGGGPPAPLDFAGLHAIISGKQVDGTVVLANAPTGMFGTGVGSILRKRFEALRALVPAIDGIDLDDEEIVDEGDTLIAFGKMLGEIGFQVTFCPYNNGKYWKRCLSELQRAAPGLVTGYHLQCYNGWNQTAADRAAWRDGVRGITGIDEDTFITPGSSAELQSAPGDLWWDAKAGGFIWKYSCIIGSTAKWASALGAKA